MRKWGLGITAVIATVVGGWALLVPSTFFSGMGSDIQLSPMLGLFVQFYGAAYLGLGAINWLCLRAAPSAALRAVLVGNLVFLGANTVLNALFLLRGLDPAATGNNIMGIVSGGIPAVLIALALFRTPASEQAEKRAA
jgi:hypothetical protein